mgnify:CR=1 FL=1
MKRRTRLRLGSLCRGIGIRNRRGTDLGPSFVVSWIVFVVATKGAEVYRYACVYPYVVDVPGCAGAVVVAAAILVLASEEILSNVHLYFA